VAYTTPICLAACAMAMVRYTYQINRPPGAPTEGSIIMAQFTTAQVAEKLDTTPRTLRKFLRADARSNDRADSLPGKGSRYAIEGKELKGLQGRFNRWQAAEAAARAERAAKAAEDAQATADEATDEVIDDDSNA
jgi:hypothetical protein